MGEKDRKEKGKTRKTVEEGSCCVLGVWKEEREREREGKEEDRKKAGNQIREMKERRGQERESVTQLE